MRQIWFQQTGRESALRRPDRAVNGYSSRPGTKPIHPLRHLEKGERGKRWRKKNMRCCLFLAAGINYSAKGRDRLTLAILFLVPLMTVVVNIHRQTPCPSLCSPTPPSQWQKYFNSFNWKICLSPQGATDSPQQSDICIQNPSSFVGLFFFPHPPPETPLFSLCPFEVPIFAFKGSRRWRVFLWATIVLVGVKVMVVNDSLVFVCGCLNLQGQGETFGPEWRVKLWYSKHIPLYV